MAAKFLASSPSATLVSFRQTTAAAPFSVLSSPKFLKSPAKKSVIRAQVSGAGDADHQRFSSPLEVVQFKNQHDKQFVDPGFTSLLEGSRRLEPVWISSFVPLDPLSRLTTMRHQLRDANVAMDHLIEAMSMFLGEGHALRDVHVGDHEIRLWLDMPGLSKDDFKVGVDVANDLLVIIRKGRMEHVKDDGSWNYTKYDTLLHLPKDCELNRITADFHDGVLYISVPKKKSGLGSTETTKPTAPENEARAGEVRGIGVK